MLGKSSDTIKNVNLGLVLFLGTFTGAFIYYQVENKFLSIGFIALLVVGASVLYVKMVAWFSHRNNYDTGKIILMPGTGFILERKKKQKQINWSEVKQFEYLGSWICFDMKDGSCVCIKEYLEGVKEWLPVLPKSKAASESVMSIVQGEMENHDPSLNAGSCKICGFIAVKPSMGVIAGSDTICLVCMNEPWNALFSETQEVYHRRLTLEHFEIYTEYEPVNFHPKEKEYRQDPKWTPSVTEAEVRAWSAQKNDFYNEKPREIKEAIPADPDKCLPCMVCGFFAIPHPDDPAAAQDSTCQVCFSEAWKVGSGNEVDYLRECQLEHFATFDPEDRVVFYLEEENYRPVPHWKPRVTEEEILAFSKKEYWGS